MHLEHVTDIAAPVARVWDLPVDAERWRAVTPSVTHLERLDDGPLQLGSRARITQPGQGPRVWTVTRLDEPKTFAWQTRVLGIRMVGTHRIEPTASGCRNHLRLDLEGRGAGLLGRFVGRRMAEALATENAGFKRVAESG